MRVENGIQHILEKAIIANVKPVDSEHYVGFNKHFSGIT
jgi:hypothetical protein